MTYATVGLSVVDDAGAMHVRSWVVPAVTVDALAAQLTVTFGEPSEMVSDIKTMTKGADRAAAEDGAVFMFPGEVPGG